MPTLESDILSFLESADWKSIAGQTASDGYDKAVLDLEVILSEIDKTSRLIALKTTAMEADD